jgi:hypothetical protein
MTRQQQNASCLESVVTQTMIDWQKAQPIDRVSRLMVHRGMAIESGLSAGLSIPCLSAERDRS